MEVSINAEKKILRDRTTRFGTERRQIWRQTQSSWRRFLLTRLGRVSDKCSPM